MFLAGFLSGYLTRHSCSENRYRAERRLARFIVWMKDHTPEPFSDPGYFNKLYSEPPSGEDYAYPPSAYGVLSAWDYGHWITEIAHRIPDSIPTSPEQATQLYFLPPRTKPGLMRSCSG